MGLKMEAGLIRVDPWCYIFGAVLLLLVPLNWLAAGVLAAIFHEICHYLAVRVTGGNVWEIRVGMGGAVMQTSALTRGQELICAVAGPMGSFCLLFLCRVFPRLAICGLIQGVFNMLPVFPMDGGRILRCMLEGFFPSRGERLSLWVEWVVRMWLLMLSLVLMVKCSWGIYPALVVFLWIARGLLRKRPCKQKGIGVQ